MKKIKFGTKPKPNENTRICFDCNNEYTPKKRIPPLIYCPYCGKKTFGFDEESYIRLQNEDNNLPDETKLQLKKLRHDKTKEETK